MYSRREFGKPAATLATAVIPRSRLLAAKKKWRLATPVSNEEMERGGETNKGPGTDPITAFATLTNRGDRVPWGAADGAGDTPIEPALRLRQSFESCKQALA